MGSLTSRPKVPSTSATTTIQYVPVTAATSSSGTAISAATSADSNTDATQNTQSTSENSASEQRKNNLLKRNRGQAGTVLTGFKGLLARNDQTVLTRKSLLGE